MSILWDRRVIIIQRLKSGLIHKGVSRADQRDAEEYRTRNVKSRSQRCQSWWEHLDVLRGELDQSLCNRDGLRRWSDLSHISRPSFMLLLPVFIYLPELTHRCPFSRFLPCLWCCLDFCLNINEVVSQCITNSREQWLKVAHLTLTPFLSPLLFSSLFLQEIAAYLITFEKHEEWLTTSPKTR